MDEALVRRLQLKPEIRVMVLNAPDGYLDPLTPLPRLRAGRGAAWVRIGAGLAAGALLLSLSGCAAGPAAGSARYRAVSQQPGDGITIEDGTHDVTIDITSESGIGSMEIQRLGPPPKTLTVNFHLKGLEEMTLSWGDTRVTAHVASGSGNVHEEMGQGGAPAAAIDSTSPYWMPIRIEAEDATIPLKDGYFAVTTPPAFIQAAPQRFLLKWIDFYR